jgi:hypothetical protein
LVAITPAAAPAAAVAVAVVRQKGLQRQAVVRGALAGLRVLVRDDLLRFSRCRAFGVLCHREEPLEVAVSPFGGE